MNDEPRGILVPFTRDKKRDFASGTGDALLRACRRSPVSVGIGPGASKS